MKKILAAAILLLPVPLLAQEQDSLFLKNGKKLGGKIYKMEDGKIYFKNGKDSSAFTSSQVDMIMFCSKDKKNCPTLPPCNDKPGASSRSKSSNASTFSSLDENNRPDNSFMEADIEKGTVMFTCNMCSGNGNLFIRSADAGRSTASFSFTLAKDKHYFLYIIKLMPGNYSWSYDDNYNNESKGKFTIAKNGEKKIILFEKE